VNAPASRNVRIPATPALLLRLIHEFSVLRDIAVAHHDYWPADLDEWARYLEEWRASI
jgi:hypothetical protein